MAGGSQGLRAPRDGRGGVIFQKDFPKERWQLLLQKWREQSADGRGHVLRSALALLVKVGFALSSLKASDHFHVLLELREVVVGRHLELIQGALERELLRKVGVEVLPEHGVIVQEAQGLSANCFHNTGREWRVTTLPRA